GAAAVGGDRVAEFLGFERNGMAFVDRLAVDDRFGWLAVVVGARVFIGLEFGAGAVLAHVEIEPGGVGGPFGGAALAAGVGGPEMRSAVAGFEAAGHGFDDRPVAIVFDRAVAAEDPDEAAILVAPAEPFAVDFGVFGSEDFGAGSAAFVPLVAPGREEADI